MKKPHALFRHSAPAAGFELPLEMLAAFHDRVEGLCNNLHRLVAHLARHGADRSTREAAAVVMRYFDTSARHHHADEEEDLFPALMESMAGSDAVCLRELTTMLTAEHRELEHCWQGLRRRLDLLAGGHTATLPDDKVLHFVGLYQRRIGREESELLPVARRLLSDPELDRISQAMRARRSAGDPANLPKPSTA